MVQAAAEQDRASGNISTTPSSLFEEVADILIDPASGDAITVRDATFTASTTRREISVVDGIPNFFVPAEFPPGKGLSDVTDMVRAFYEETPFPNYDGFDSRESL